VDMQQSMCLYRYEYHILTKCFYIPKFRYLQYESKKKSEEGKGMALDIAPLTGAQ